MDSELRRRLLAVSEGDRGITADDARAVLALTDDQTPDLLAITDGLRRERFGNRVNLCAIVNAKSGRCGEDCRFCAQSAHYRTPAQDTYAMLPGAEIAAARERAGTAPIECFSPVTSGGAMSDDELDGLCTVIAESGPGPAWCASLGLLDEQQLGRLRRAGLRRYHHNLETSPSYYPEICTTHAVERRLETVRAAKRAGLEVCSGGILGMGESDAQRVEFALTLRELGVDSIPLNFLMAIDGTPLADRPPLQPLEILRCIAMFRLVNLGCELRVAGGRQLLGPLQPLIFWAGCTGMMVGDLLTTTGSAVDADLAMLDSLGLQPVLPAKPA